MSKFVILDNVLNGDDRSVILNSDYPFASDELEKFYYLNSNPVHEKLVDIARQHFDLSIAVGYEMWKPNRAAGWHVDKDERHLRDTGETNYPLCNMVYYAQVDCDGGDFFTDDIMLRPVTNRLIILSSGTWHGVKPYRGERFAVAINPWHYDTNARIAQR